MFESSKDELQNSSKLVHDQMIENFFQVRESLVSRPWVFDDIDKFLERLFLKVTVPVQSRYKKVLVFVDNAGTNEQIYIVSPDIDDYL